MTTTWTDDAPSSLYRFADLTLDVARRCVTARGPADRAQGARLRFAALSSGVGAERRERRRPGREGLGPALREPRERRSARDVAAAKPGRRRESAPLHRDDSQQGLPAHPSRGDACRPKKLTRRQRRWRSSRLSPPPLLLAAVPSAQREATGSRERQERQQALPSSVAVLPFENLSPERRRCVFRRRHAGRDREPADEDQRPAAYSPYGRVTTRTQRSHPDIARDLNVATALGGSVYYAEGRVRVTPHLTDAATGVSLWSNSYERELSDIFAHTKRNRLGRGQELSIELSATERERVERVPTTNPQAS